MPPAFVNKENGRLHPYVLDHLKDKWKEVDLNKIKAEIQEELSCKEITETNMHMLGNLIYGIAMTLSQKVNEELLGPISQWMDDPDWMNRFKIIEDHTPNWAAYKRKQRRWSKQQKYLAAERLKLYRQEILTKRSFRHEISKMIGRAQPRQNVGLKFDHNFIAPIISSFSPPEQRKVETQLQFQQALSLSVSDLLPWKLLLMAELSEIQQTKRLTELKTHYPEDKKKDIVSKFIHLLELEKEGEVTTGQEKPFGDITIRLSQPQIEATITVTDQHGFDYTFEWFELGANQKAKIIDDIKTYKILCKRAQAE